MFSSQKCTWSLEMCPKRYSLLRRRCDTCSKTFAHRQSLFKHRKICKGAQTSTVPTVIESNSPRFNGKQHLEDIHPFESAQDKSPIPDPKMPATIINNGEPSVSPEALEFPPTDLSDASDDKDDTATTTLEILPSGNYGIVDWFKQKFRLKSEVCNIESTRFIS